VALLLLVLARAAAARYDDYYYYNYYNVINGPVKVLSNNAYNAIVPSRQPAVFLFWKGIQIAVEKQWTSIQITKSTTAKTDTYYY
jgi:hypothetical protein